MQLMTKIIPLAVLALLTLTAALVVQPVQAQATPTITGLTIAAASITETGATADVSINNPDRQPGTVYLRYRTPPAGPGSWSSPKSAPFRGSSAQFTLSGLAPSTEYRVQVSLHSTSFRPRESQDITTLAAPAPTGVTVSSVEQNSASFTAAIADGHGVARTVYFRYRTPPTTGVWSAPLKAQGTTSATQTAGSLSQDSEYEVEASLLANFITAVSETFATLPPVPIPGADEASSARYAYLSTVHLTIGANANLTGYGYRRNGFGALNAGELPGELFADGLPRPVSEISVHRTSHQLRLVYHADETGLFRDAEGLKWLRVQVRQVDNRIAGEANLWSTTSCAARTICGNLDADISGLETEAVAVDFFDAVQEVLDASPGGAHTLVLASADTGSDSTGYDLTHGHHIGGHLLEDWFSDGGIKPAESIIIHHGSSTKVLELGYGSALAAGLWRYAPGQYRDYRLKVLDRHGNELLRIDMGEALATLSAADRRCGDATAQRRICFPYDADFDGSDYRGQVMLVQLESLTWIRLLSAVPGGPVGGQMFLMLFAGAMFGWQSRKLGSPVRELIICLAVTLAAGILPVIGIGSLFWPIGALILSLLATAAIYFLKKEQ